MILSENNTPGNLFLTLSLAVVSTFISVLFSQTLHFFNSIIAFLSSFLFIYAIIITLNKRVLRSHLIFLFTFYIGLYFNTYMLSHFQTEKNYLDLYYFFVGPLSFYFVLYLFERSKFNMFDRKNEFININSLFILLLISYILLKLYISSQVGWRISSFETSTFLQDGSLYSVPGYSGLAAILQWTLIIFSPYTKRKYIIIAITAIIIFSYLHVKRGDILRIFIFYIIFFSFKIINGDRLIKRKISIKSIVKITIMVLSLLITFIILGNIRETLRGGDETSLAYNIGIKDAPSYLSWFYGYVPINYEVIRYYFDESPSYYPKAVLSPLLGYDESNSNFVYSINGFNASTLLKTFINDYGEFYFLEMILFAIIIGFIIKTAKKENFLGCYVYILTILFYSFFGNYFEARSMFVPIIISLAIFPFVRIGKNKSKFDGLNVS